MMILSFCTFTRPIARWVVQAKQHVDFPNQSHSVYDRRLHFSVKQHFLKLWKNCFHFSQSRENLILLTFNVWWNWPMDRTVWTRCTTTFFVFSFLVFFLLFDRSFLWYGRFWWNGHWPFVGRFIRLLPQKILKINHFVYGSNHNGIYHLPNETLSGAFSSSSFAFRCRYSQRLLMAKYTKLNKFLIFALRTEFLIKFEEEKLNCWTHKNISLLPSFYQIFFRFRDVRSHSKWKLSNARKMLTVWWTVQAVKQRHFQKPIRHFMNTILNSKFESKYCSGHNFNF